MAKNMIANVALALAEHQQTGGLEERVNITLTKEPGSDTFHRSFEASNSTAAINALGILTLDVAKQLNVPVIHVISVLTLMLTDTGEHQA